MASRFRSRSRILAAVALLMAVALVPMAPATPALGAGGPVVFVDGKLGSDAAGGRSLADAFKTVKRGLWEIRYGGRLEVVGYSDHVYRETMTESQWFINGSSDNPIVIQGFGYGTAGFVRPTISGALVVARPGSGLWTRPDPVAYPDVWSTPWSTAITGYQPGVRAHRQERVFVDVAQPLIRPKDVPTLADLQATPGSQYWNGKVLYVRLGGWGAPTGASLSLNPNDHLIEIPHYKGILVASGSSYVVIRGFNIRHTTMGVGFTGTSTRNTVEDVDASYNNPMGFFTQGGNHTFRRVTGSRNTIQLIKLDNGAHHNLVEHAVGIENLGQGIKLTGANCAFNTIRSSRFEGGKRVPMSAGQYGGYIQGIDIEQGAHDNTIERNTITDMRRGIMLYQLNASGGPLTGNKIRFNRFEGNDTAVVIWDGKYSSTNGSGTVLFQRNLYVGNRRGVMTESVTRNKTFDRETFFRTGTTGTVSQSAFYLKAGAVNVRNSIVRRTAGYAFYTKAGAKINVAYTAVSSNGLGVRNSSTGVVLGTGYRSVSPGFLSEDAASADFLYIGPASVAYTMGSTGGPIGARWR
jgi:hypothetical protein